MFHPRLTRQDSEGCRRLSVRDRYGRTNTKFLAGKPQVARALSRQRHLKGFISMADTNDPKEKRRPARALAEQALHAELTGDQEKAEELFAEAQRIDPEETLEVLQERTPPAHDSANRHTS